MLATHEIIPVLPRSHSYLLMAAEALPVVLALMDMVLSSLGLSGGHAHYRACAMRTVEGTHVERLSLYAVDAYTLRVVLMPARTLL